MSDMVKRILSWILVVGLILAVFLLGRSCGSHSQDSTVQKLSAQVAQNERTIQLKAGLYSTAVAKLSDLQGLLDSTQKSVADLKKQLASSHDRLLTVQQLEIRWKNAYEGELQAKQSDGSAGNGTVGDPVVRKRVDFQGDLGPISAIGYTLTDPAEAHLKIAQLRPIILDVSVARQPDGSWVTYTTTDSDIDVNVKLAGVNPGVTSPDWKHRIYLDAGIYPFGEIGGSIGLSYHFDSWSLGFSCADIGGVQSCGANVGIQIFR